MTAAKSPDRAVAGGALVFDRALPDFIVIGAMRAGTTTLYHHLNNHPDIGMSRMKETDFFIAKMNYPLGLEWYRSQFAPGFRVYGEVSPNYAMCHLWHGVPKRIKNAAPHAKLIFLARDPVERFVSHYLTAWHVGLTRVPSDVLLGTDTGRNMLDTSRYALQISAYLDHFDPARLLVLDFDTLRTDPQATFDRVTAFLGLDRHDVAATATRNDTASTARLPGFAQRIWRHRHMRRFDGYISRGMRDQARRLLSLGRRRPDPAIAEDLRARAAENLADDAAAFRRMTRMAFESWRV